MTLSLIFWAVLAAYIVHILDETLMGGGFVQKVRQHWWAEYHMEMFFWFNTAFIIAIALSNGLYDALGRHWIILPLFWTFERASHVITLHLWWSIRYKEYSPGLLSGLLFWILTYFLIRCGVIPGLISKSDFLVGLITGCAGGFLLSILPTRIMPRISRRRFSS